MRSRKGWIGGANFRVDVLCQPIMYVRCMLVEYVNR